MSKSRRDGSAWRGGWTAVLVLVLAVAAAGCGGKAPHSETGSSAGTPARRDNTTAKRKPSLQSAFDAARYYLDTDAVSKRALLQRMSANGFETYSEAEALYAVNHLQADWKAEAVEDAKRRESPISPKRLMWYLTEDDQFSKAEATYALRHAGRDWKAEAVMAAKATVAADALSTSRLARELKLEGYTDAQVRYAVEKVR